MKVITDRRFVCTKLHIYIFIAVRSIILHTLFSVYEIQPHWLSTEKRLYCIQFQTYFHRIGGVMVSVLTSSTVDRGFKPRSGQTKDYKIGICCFSVKHAELRRKSKDWLVQNQNDVSE
jgi:hypothetical protein